MSIKALREYTRYAKYAKHDKSKSRRETWEEQVDRVFKMHEEKFKDKLGVFRKEFDFAKEMVNKKLILGSQRALQFGGPAILSKEARIYNCTVSYADRPRFFQETLWLLLCGCGVGFSVQKHHVAKLPKIKNRSKESFTYVVPDTIEGWSEALGILINSFFEGNNGKKPIFDFKEIRPAGAPLSWGGKAPGPDGLHRSLDKIEELLEKCLTDGKKQLSPIDVYDIIMHTSDAVLSGGIRRSATICIFSVDDEEMITAKTGDWFNKNPQRGRSNNSAILIREKTSKEQFSKLMKSVREFGEPGFIWADDTEALYNPCVEIGMRAYDADGNSGWQFCLTGDTLIQTKNGFERLDNLDGKKIEIISPYSNDCKSYLDSSDNILNNAFVLNTGKKKVFKIKTISGPEIRATLNHSFLTQRGYVKVEDLKIETDCLVSTMSCSNNTNNKWHIKDNYMPNEYDMLGWNLGDGWCSGIQSFGLVFGSREDDYAEEKLLPVFSKLLNETDGGSYGNRYGDVNFHIDQSNNGVRTYVSSNGSKMDEIIKKWGISIGTAHSKRIMNSYWNSSLENKARYISSWFCSDGSVINKNGIKRISITIANDTLAEELQIALTEFGIVSRRTPHIRLRDGKNQTILYIGNKIDIELFKEKIGFRLHPRKNEDLNNIFWEKEGTTDRGLFKIKSIEFFGEETVYDVSVENSHNFNANGLVVHNCNLCEINMKKVKSEEDFLNACRAAAILGTMQAAYDNFPYLGEVTSKIVKREALLGVSMTGMMDSPDIAFNKEIQRKGSLEVLTVNAELAPKLGINVCARATCIKPAGCLSADTRVKTSNGIKSLMDIFDEQGYTLSEIENLKNTWLELKKPLTILNENNKEEEVSKLYVNGKCRVYEVETETGVIRCTPWHKFKLTNGIWKRADELMGGDDIQQW